MTSKNPYEAQKLAPQVPERGRTWPPRPSAAPSVAKAQGPISMRWQSTWPSKDIFHEFALDFAKKVNDMTGGDLNIEVLPAGAVVPAFGLLDAVSEGTLDGGHGVLVYHYGKQTALALWGSGPGFAMDANMLLAWHKYGGGKELLAKLYASIGANVVSFPYGPMPTQPLGWFKKPVAKVEDLNGLKFRTVGISIDVFTGLGAAVNALPGGEIVAALDRGLLDAAEFNNASSDRVLGFPDVSKVCMLQSYHQNAEQFEILFNKAKYDALPEQMKAIIANAVEAASQDMSWKAIDRYSKDYSEMQTKDNVKFYKTPDAILKKQLEVYDEVVKKKAAENPLFKEILESQIAFARAGDAVGTGHGRQPPHGLRSLLRARTGQRRSSEDAFKQARRRRADHRTAPCLPIRHSSHSAVAHERPAFPEYGRWNQHVGRQGRGVADHRADGAGLRRGLQALHPEHADGVDIRRQQHALRHAVHARRSLRAGAECPCPRRFSLQLDAAPDAGGARSCALHRFLPARHRRPRSMPATTMPRCPGGSASIRP